MTEEISKIISNSITTYTKNLNLCIPFILNIFMIALTAIVITIFSLVYLFGSVFNKNNWECRRADEIFEPTQVVNIIWEQILRSNLIISDLTGKNANVFYELGYAHALGKDTILITQSIDDIPFDLRHLRCIQYSKTTKGYQKLSEIIQKSRDLR